MNGAAQRIALKTTLKTGFRQGSKRFGQLPEASECLSRERRLARVGIRFPFFIIKRIRGSGRVLSLEFRAVGRGVSVSTGCRGGVER